MRPETQKQIVKAFAMMFDDSDMQLSELIEKLESLNGGQKKSKRVSPSEKHKGPITDQQILSVFKSHGPTLRTSQICSFLKEPDHKRIQYQMNRLVSQGKVEKKVINARMFEFTLVK